MKTPSFWLGVFLSDTLQYFLPCSKKQCFSVLNLLWTPAWRPYGAMIKLKGSGFVIYQCHVVVTQKDRRGQQYVGGPRWRPYGAMIKLKGSGFVIYQCYVAVTQKDRRGQQYVGAPRWRPFYCILNFCYIMLKKIAVFNRYFLNIKVN